MKILLVQLPLTYELPIYYQAESLGIAYIASYLRRDGHDVEVLDAQIKGVRPADTSREILSREFDCLGLSAAHEQKNTLFQVVRTVRKARPDSVILAGGYLPTLCSNEILTRLPELDFVVRGEGEISASDAIGRIARGEPWQEAPGIAYIKDGMPVTNPSPPLIKELDALPFPARDALSQMEKPVNAGIAGSRGCYHRCSFCCVRSFYSIADGLPARFRSAKSIVDEIESVVSSVGAQNFRFVDDDFIGPGQKSRDRVTIFANELKARNLGVTFEIETRADEVDRDVLLMLKDVGLREVFLGVESASQSQLDRYNKHMTVDQNRKAIEAVREAGLKLRCGFIMFDPYLTVPELVENMQFVQETGIAQEAAKVVKVPFVTRVAVHKGVPLAERLQEDGLLIDKGIDVDYKFKDPGIRVIYKGLNTLGKISDFVRRIPTLFSKNGHTRC